MKNEALSPDGDIQGITRLHRLGQNDAALLVGGNDHGGIIPQIQCWARGKPEKTAGGPEGRFQSSGDRRQEGKCEGGKVGAESARQREAQPRATWEREKWRVTSDGWREKTNEK